MKRIYDANLKASVTVDDAGQVRGIKYHDKLHEIKHFKGGAAAEAYLHQIAENLKIAPESLRSLNHPLTFLNPEKKEVEYRLSEQKSFFDTTTYAYYQTYLNTPVWGGGMTVTVKHDPVRIVSMVNTGKGGIDAKLPTVEDIDRYLKLFATGEKFDGKKLEPKAKQSKSSNSPDSKLLSDMLDKAIQTPKELSARKTAPKLIRGRFFVYCYDAAKRTTDFPDQKAGEHEPGLTHDLSSAPPTLLLCPVPKSIQDGNWYVVSELIVRLPYQGSHMNWRMLVEVKTNTILYLRSLSSGVNGLVFYYDPITSTGDTGNTPNQGNAVLNPHRTDVVLPNLDPPVAGTQSLRGSLVVVTDIESPSPLNPPTRPAGSDFDYNVRTNAFAAVNAYYHNDRFFRLVESLGFPLATYFDGTSFPVEIDHRGLGNIVNAHCIGDGDGIDHACYALADSTDIVNPMGIAADWRVVLHELGGHGILYDHVNSPNFGFAHSAGDSFAMILNDFASEWHNGAALDRFFLVPFVPSIVRRSDRT
ncbi:MAG: hypothetical protein ACKVT2_05950, partial [Saprospiraceae bacterium]